MTVFENLDYPKSLNEEVFDSWLEQGRQSKLGYMLLLIVWDDFEHDFLPVFAQSKSKIEEFGRPGSREKLIAVYDLYSESRIM